MMVGRFAGPPIVRPIVVAYGVAFSCATGRTLPFMASHKLYSVIGFIIDCVKGV